MYDGMFSGSISGLKVEDTATLMLFQLGSLVQCFPVVVEMSMISFFKEPSPSSFRRFSKIVGAVVAERR